MVRYDDLKATGRLVPGRPVRVTGTDQSPITNPIEHGDDSQFANGEIVAAMATELALRVWERVPGLQGGHMVMLRVQVENDAALFLADVGPVEPPAPGETFWASVPFEWIRLNRRGSFRLDVDLPVLILLPGMSNPVLRRMLDLSQTGCRVEAVASHLDDIVQLRFGLMPVAREIVLRARVVRTGKSGGVEWTALEFQDIVAADRDRLVRYMMDEQRRLFAQRLRR